jgi:hypothetical protein
MASVSFRGTWPQPAYGGARWPWGVRTIAARANLHRGATPICTYPVDEVYDCAGQLVQAGREIGVAAGRPGTAPALTATLGCLEAALDADLEVLRQELDQASRAARAARRAVGPLVAEGEPA